MVKVSVIIPVYNAEEYLEECLNSIVNQTLKDLEIICINDGSTDNSLKILEEYQAKDNRFRIFSQRNQGQGVARNNALRYVRGKYFAFMDADDKLELNTLERCYNECEDKFLDMVMYPLINLDDEKGTYYKTPLYDMFNVARKIENKVFNYKDLGELIFNVSVTPVNKLYNTEFVRNTKVTFPVGTIFEDNIFSWNLIFKARRIYFIEEYFYIRRVRSNSTTTSGNKRWCDAIDIYNSVWKIFQEHGEFENYKTKLYNNKIIFALFRLDNIKFLYKNLFFQKLKEDLINVQQSYPDFKSLLELDNKKQFDLILASKDYEEYINFSNMVNLSEKIDDIEMQYVKIKDNFNVLSKEYETLFNKNQELISINKQLEQDKINITNEKNNLHNSFKDSDEKINNLNNTIQNLTENNQSLTNNNQNLNNRIKTLENEKNDLRDSYNSLKETNKDLVEFKENVYSSTSWKITEPLRKIVSAIKGNN